MQINSTQNWMLLASSFFILLVCCFISSEEKVIHLQNEKTPSTFTFDTTFLFQKTVILNRLPQFISYLNSKNIRVDNNYELLLLLSNPIARQQISQQFKIESNLLLLHAELADLIQIGMTELDAQIIHFSQRNYQNPYTGETMNLRILAEADVERLLQDMGGWMAGNGNVLLEGYELSIEEIEVWIEKARRWEFKFFVVLLLILSL